MKNDISAAINRARMQGGRGEIKVAFEGRDGTDWIIIRLPGARDSLERPVTSADVAQYKGEYTAYLNGKSPPGTPPLAKKRAEAPPPGIRAELDKLEARIAALEKKTEPLHG